MTNDSATPRTDAVIPSGDWDGPWDMARWKPLIDFARQLEVECDELDKAAVTLAKENAELRERLAAAEKENARLRDPAVMDLQERAEAAESRLAGMEADALRYRWLRSEEVATDPRFYPFWQEFNAKLCREENMDAAIDAARGSYEA